MKKILCILIIFLSLLGCDGGTSGSGLKTYEGVVTSTDGEPIANANLTIETTGDSGTTDKNGAFSFTSTASGAEVPFLVEASNFITRFSVQAVPDESSRVSVDVTINTESDTATVSHVSIKARVVGLCDYYFENKEIIRQANQVPDGTHCSIRVEVLGDGKPLGNVPVALQFASCDENAVWETLKSTTTGVGKFKGVTEFQFDYRDSPTYCRYRVLAPFNDRRFRAAIYPIDTFTEQGIFHPDDR